MWSVSLKNSLRIVLVKKEMDLEHDEEFIKEQMRLWEKYTKEPEPDFKEELFYPCNDCSKSYKTVDGIIKHAKIMHDKELTIDTLPEKKSKKVKKQKPSRKRKFNHEDKECLICMTTIKSYCACYPCGHANCCYKCLSNASVLKCPICREEKKDVIKLYF